MQQASNISKMAYTPVSSFDKSVKVDVCVGTENEMAKGGRKSKYADG